MISASDINKWKNKGYTVLKNVLNKKLVIDCKKFLDNKYYNNATACKDFGSNGELEFPSKTKLDKITLNENIINIVKKLLNDDNICY